MLGLGDIWVFLAYVLCIASAIICVIYGILNWNKGAEEADEETREWIEEEIEVEKPL